MNAVLISAVLDRRCVLRNAEVGKLFTRRGKFEKNLKLGAALIARAKEEKGKHVKKKVNMSSDVIFSTKNL